MSEYTGYIEDICGLVDSLPTVIDINIVFESWYYDLTPAHENCASARSFLITGQAEESLASLQLACVDITEMLTSRPGGNAQQLIDSMSSLLSQTSGYATSVVGVLNSIDALRIMLPAAVSLAPGIIRGSVITKALVPQSTFPGIFIITVPILYCPIVWCTYLYISTEHLYVFIYVCFFHRFMH